MYDSIIILGATATGKTGLSIKLAQKLNTEIINADSMYIYDKLNIGTAKPTETEMNHIKHHLIGFVDPQNAFNVSMYRIEAEKIINAFKSENKLPIIVGGTGFYIDSLIKNYSYGETIKNEEIRDSLENDYREHGLDYLYNKLSQVDPESASKIHKNDKTRVIRALEIYYSSGQRKSEIINLNEPILKNPLIIGLNIPRETLYERINKRVDLMLSEGLINEVLTLYNSGLTPENSQSMKGIGYKEIIDYLRGNISFEEAIEKVKQHTRNYAKRQITWFKRNDNIIWFNPLEEENLEDKIIKLYNESK